MLHICLGKPFADMTILFSLDIYISGSLEFEIVNAT